jgi:gp020
MRDLYLYHHGIRGQRWGIRRFQNEDGSLTKSGKKRYDVDIETAKNKYNIANHKSKEARKEYYKKASENNTAVYNKSLEAKRYAKRKLKDELIKEKLNNETKISKRREKLQQEYLRKGMNVQEAAIAAYKREKTEKAVKAVAAIAITAAIAYGGYKYYDKNVDKVIHSDKVIQRISPSSTMAVRDAFYFSMNRGDNTAYRGMYGAALKRNNANVFEKTYRVENAIKVASEKSAVKTLKELTSNDRKYVNDLRSHLEDIYSSMNDANSHDKQIKVMRKGVEAIKKGHINADVYRALNFTLPYHNNVNKAFYDRLSSKGYNAIVDINDKYLSGYGARNPMIAFNAVNNVKANSLRALSVSEIRDNYKKFTIKNTIRQVTKATAETAAFAIAGKVAVDRLNSYKDSKQRNKVLEIYKKEHPKTKLSDAEILNEYYNY